MNTRIVFISVLVVACLLAVVAVIAQRRQLASLKGDQQQFQMSAATSSETNTIASSPHPSAELLELRSKVTQLTARRNELAGVNSENENSHANIAVGGTSNSVPVSDGFIRKSEAKWLGTGKPEDTFQSALWALHNRRLDAFLGLLNPSSAERVRQQIGSSPEKFLAAAAAIPAMRVSNLRFFGAATMKGNLDVSLNDPTSRPIFFFLLDGQWKIVLDNEETRFTR
jgi:hypothetical protein